MKNNKSNNKKDNSMAPLNDELGFFDLEPPKIYRSDQSVNRSTQADKKGKKASTKAKQPLKKAKADGEVRSKKKRKLKKKFRLAFTAVGMIALIALIIVVLSLTVFFKIDTINVEGTKKYSYKQVTSVLPIDKEKNLFLIDKKGATKKLEENLPYIYDVEITRKLPSTVVVKITEPQLIYYVKNSDNTYTYFDDNFKILEVNVKEPAEKGIELKKIAFSEVSPGKTAKLTNEELLSDLQVMMQTVTSLKLKEVTAIYSESLVNNYVVYDNRITIKLGETKDIEDKLFTALTAIEKLNDTAPDAEGTLTATNSKQIYFTEKK